MSSRKILGVDFDDVLLDNNTSVARFHNERYGTSYVKEDNVDYFFEHLWGVSTDEVIRRLDEWADSEYHKDAPIIDGARDALKKLKSRYDIVIISARPESSREVTEEWLQRHLPDFVSGIHFTGRVNHGSITGTRKKSDVCNALGVSCFVEDALHWAEDIAAHAPHTEVLLFDSPWNRSEIPEGVTRVHSWEDIVSRLMKPDESDPRSLQAA
ncbi:MAG: hypothetical protein Q7R74_00835 [bacterium]|nr:hypothetical protein [bacterium]